MYFHKSPDALAPDGAPDATPANTPDANAVALATPPALPPGSSVSDVPTSGPGSLPPVAHLPVPDRPIPVVPSVVPPAVVASPGDATYDRSVAPPPLPAYSPPPDPAYGRSTPDLPYAAAAQSAAQPPKDPKAPNFDLPPEVTRLPARQEIFELRSTPTLEVLIKEQVRSTLGQGKDPPQSMTPFPPLPVIVAPGTPYVAKTPTYPNRQAVYEPGFVIHRRLHFEERNAERYGWDLGFIQPVVSTLYFYRDVMLWPQSLATSLVTGAYDTNAGKCLPGSAVPYNLYPVGLTLTGSAFEGAVVTGLLFTVFP